MALSLAVVLMAGLLAALLTNYFADELPRTRRLSHPACRNCGEAYTWQDYLTVRACSTCGFRRGLRPWVVLIVLFALSAYVGFRPQQLPFPLSLVLLLYFAVVIVIDLEHRLILAPTSLAGAALAVVLGWRLHGWLPTLIGGFAGFAIMAALYFLGTLVARARRRRLAAAGHPGDDEEALGGGDVILAAVLGLLLGWPLIWFGLLLGILVGGAIGLVIVLTAIARGQYARQALTLFMPYGPAFVLSAFLIVFVPGAVASLLPG
jgi:leader peptidase (prepilin peptidase) / N-methyltransferase